MTWCDAQTYCSSVGGELVRGASYVPLINKTLQVKPANFWIGLTDLLHERDDETAGWMWTDGATVPSSSQLNWLGSNTDKTNEDCVSHSSKDGKVFDMGCLELLPPLCQPRQNASSIATVKNFQPSRVPIVLPYDNFAIGECSKKLTRISSKIDCFHLCEEEPGDWCVAIYYFHQKKECLFVLFTDAMVRLEYTSDIEKWMVKN